MTNIILDACAVIAYYNGEPGAERVEEVLVSRKHLCHIHAANAIELLYKIAAKLDFESAILAYSGLEKMGVSIHDGMDKAFQFRCARLKEAIPSLSLADTMAITLAMRIGGTVLTNDKQFNRAMHLVRVEQLRP